MTRCRQFVACAAALAVAWMWIGPALPLARAAERGSAAASPVRIIPSTEPGWHQWRGPRRDGICDEKNLLDRWPSNGPPVAWKASGLGQGYSAPIVVRGRILLAGDSPTELVIHCLDTDGRRIWTATNGLPWKDPYPGARAACTYHDGRVYHMNAHGRVVCLSFENGRELWAVNVRELFGGKLATWAYSECLLVDRDRVIVTPGGGKALMAALDILTGRTTWTTEPLTLGPSQRPSHIRVEDNPGNHDGPGYTSPVLLQSGARRILVNCSQRHVFGVDADTGKLLWTRPLRTQYQVIALTPIVLEDGFLITAPHTDDGRRYRLARDGADVTAVWSTRLDTCHGGGIYREGMIYASWYGRGKGFACVDAKDGKALYTLDSVAKGSLLWAEGLLYALSEQGEMLLLKPGADSFEIRGRFRLVDGRKNDVWTHPVIAQGKLLLRYNDQLTCYQVARP